MLRRSAFVTLTSLALATASFAASAAILFQNLGTSAPPATIGGHTLLPFDQAPQNVIPNYSTVTSIPGSPVPGALSLSASAMKYPFTDLNATWGHGYNGPLFTTPNVTTFTLPPNTRAFYLYAMGNAFGPTNITATSDSGMSSGPVQVTVNNVGGPDSSNGFAFYSTAGETITTVTISNSSLTDGFIVGEFGLAAGPAATCASSGYKGAQLTWCQNICENGLTGKVLDSWIHRWIERYRQLPYCAVEGGGE